MKTEGTTEMKTTRNGIEVLNCLLTVTRLLGTLGGLDEKLQKVLELVLKLMAGDQGSIMLISPRTSRLQITSSVGIDEAVVRQANQQGIAITRQTIAGYVVTTGKPLMFPRDQANFLQVFSKEEGVRSSICVPLICAAGHMRGVLNINASGKEFGSADLEVAVTVAEEIATAITSRENLLLGRDATSILAGVEDPSGLSASLQAILWLTRAIRSLTLYASNDGTLFRLADSTGIRIAPDIITLSNNSSPIAQALREGRMIEFLSVKPGYQAGLALPLLVTNDGQKPIGVLVAESESPSLAIEEMAALETLAGIIGLTMSRIESQQELMALYQEIVSALGAAIGMQDEYTKDHSIAVAELAVLIAIHMGLDIRQQIILREGGVVHDVGKLWVPVSILTKPDKLTDEEFLQIKLHPEKGSRVVRQIKVWHEDGVDGIVKWHHVRWDGGGYPAGLGSHELPLLPAITSLADSVQAMGGRCYRSPKTPEQLVAEVSRCRGTQFCPDVADAFLNMGKGGFVWMGKEIRLPV